MDQPCDRQTDGQNYDSNSVHRTIYSKKDKHFNLIKLSNAAVQFLYFKFLARIPREHPD